jgi:mannose-6-phosphate isomerase-like protein (cupin superfamily)
MASRPRETTTVRLENKRVKATEHVLVPGAETGWHVHAYDYVIVPLTDGTMLLEEPDGERRTPVSVGIPYARAAGVEHNVVNDGGKELRFIEIELVG